MHISIGQSASFGKKVLKNISNTPELDIEWILLEALGESESSYIITHHDQELTLDQQERFEAMVRRRATGEPLAYIFGWWEFHSCKFIVTPDVLVPRPSTEALVDEAIIKIDALYTKLGRKVRVADIGTGSGIIGITLLRERSDKVERLYAIDVSPIALKVARKNAKLHRVDSMIEFIEGDMLKALKGRNIDLIVSNPPYVPSGELSEVTNFTHQACKVGLGEIERMGLKFEPQAALDGGDDGLKFINQLLMADVPVIYEGIGGEIKHGPI